MAMQIVIWWLVIQAFGLAGLPLARFLFRALPDRGYAFAKALGLLLTGYLAWLLAMLGLAPFGTGLLIVCGVLVSAIGLIITREQRTKNKEQNQATRPLVSILHSPSSILHSWRLVLGYEALFALALIFLALLRSYNPQPWGTERPMDFALFNAIRRSAAFPPHDPWLAGYSINYYYFGYMLMAAVALVSGLAPSVAFNLSLALVFALTALGVAGVVFNLIALTTTDDRRPTTDDRLRIEDRGSTDNGQRTTGNGQRAALRMVAIVLAVVLVLLAGNQAGALEIVTGAEISVALKGQQLAQAISNGLGPRQPLYLAPPFKANGWDFDAVGVVTPTDMWANFNWWWPSRVVWDDYPDPENPSGQPFRRYAITEFPFFSFWLGDMHPHVMALPFGLLALALALQTIARPAAPAFAMGRRGWLELALTGIVIGSLYAINSWDFPTYLLLFLGALLILHVRLGSPQDSRQETGDRRQEIRELAVEEQSAEDREPHKRIYGEPSVVARAQNQEQQVENLYGEPSVAASAQEQSAGDRATRTEVIERASTQDASPFHPLTLSPAHPFTRSPFHPLTRVWWRLFLNQMVLVVLASVVMLAPFYLTFRSLVGSKEPLLDLPILATITRTLGLVTSSRTTLFSFLLIFGLFLLPLSVYVVVQGRRAGANLTRSPAHPLTFSGRMQYAPTMVLAALVIGWLLGFPLLALLPLAIYAVSLAIGRAQQPAAAFVLWAFALVCLVCFGTEVVYIRDGFEGASARMNTIFKFYYQAWVLWGVLAGYALWWLASRRPTTDDRRPTTDDRRPAAIDQQQTNDNGRTTAGNRRRTILGRWVLTGIFGVLFMALLAGALIYPWLTAGKTLREAQRIGLEGQTPREGTPEGAASIEWLRANVPGDAVVLEAVGGSYSPEGFGGVSAATGLATVLGWPGHEDQWRGGDAAAHAQIGPRQQDVTTIYTTADVAQARDLLTKYKVGYIYLGSLERATITQAGAPRQALDKFAQLGEPVFQQGDITIYRVTVS